MNFRDFRRTEIARREDLFRKQGRRPSWDESFCLRLGVPAAYLFLRTPISAPQVLLIMLVAGLLGPLLIVQARPGPMLAGVACLALSALMDTADGIVFRHRGLPAVRGAYLDRFNHALIYPLTYTAFGFAAYRLTEDWRFVPVGMAAAMFRDAHETLGMYETKFINAHSDSVRRVRASTFFRQGMYKAGEYWWVTPFFVLRNGAGTLCTHSVVFATMAVGVAAESVPQLTVYFLAVYACRFFSNAIVSFGTTFRGK